MSIMSLAVINTFTTSAPAEVAVFSKKGIFSKALNAFCVKPTK
jgi:hypothetical protein